MIAALTAATVLSTGAPCAAEDAATTATKAGATNAEIIYNNIMTRKSVRDYQAKDLSDEQIDKLLRAAMAAPTAVNKQPWEIIVVTDKALLKKLGEALPNARMTAKAPVAFIMCGDTDKTKVIGNGAGKDFWIQDVSAATENLLLAAHGMGLGAVWTGLHPIAGNVSIVREMFKLPANIIPLCLVPVGYPAEDPAPKNKWVPEKVHYNKW